MKKILTLILAFSMLLSTALTLVGCAEKDENTLVCGVTVIPGLNEQDADGNWIGFESEFAMAVGEILGMDVEFKKIDWKQKYNELNSGAIDCVWNGFTANSSDDGMNRSDLVDFSYGYMLNQQCIVVKKSDLANYTSAADLSGKKAAVESGSAGAAYASTVTDDENITKRPTQIDTFTFLNSGAVDFLVVDIVLANNLCGNGSYSNLAIVPTIYP